MTTSRRKKEAALGRGTKWIAVQSRGLSGPHIELWTWAGPSELSPVGTRSGQSSLPGCGLSPRRGLTLGKASTESSPSNLEESPPVLTGSQQRQHRVRYLREGLRRHPGV